MASIPQVNTTDDAEISRERNLQFSEMVRDMPVDVTKLRNHQYFEMVRDMPVDLTKLRNLQYFNMSDFVPFVEVGECASYRIGENVFGLINLTSYGGFSNCTVKFQVMTPSGNVIREEDQNASLPANVETPIMFTWSSGELPLGNYYSRFLISDWLGSLILDTGWFFGFCVVEPIFVHDFGPLHDFQLKDHVISPPIELQRGEEGIFNFSLSTWISSLDIRIEGRNCSDFVAEIGNETIGVISDLYLANGSSSIRIYNTPTGNYTIRLSTASLTAEIQELSIETFSKASPTLWQKLSDECSVVDKIEGLCGTSRAYSLEVGYSTNASEYIEFSITNSSSGILLHQDIKNASLFQLSRQVNLDFEFDFPDTSTSYDLTFNLTLTETNESLIWQVPFIAKKAPYEITLKWDAKTTCYRAPAALSLFEEPGLYPVEPEDLEVLDVSDVQIIDIGVQDTILKNVTIKFQVRNKYVHHFAWMTAYTYYDLYVYPVTIGEKNVEVYRSVVLYNERENVVVSGIPVTYKDGTPTVYFYIQFKKSYWANILDWILRDGLKLILPPGSKLSGVNYFTKAVMEFVNVIADYMYLEYSIDDFNRACEKAILGGWEYLFNQHLVEYFGTSDVAEICRVIKPFSLALHIIQWKDSPQLSWKLGVSLIRFICRVFQSRMEVLYRILRDVHLALGVDWRTAGIISYEKIKEVATSLLFCLNAAEALYNCLIDVLFAPDFERKDIQASFNDPIEGEFTNVPLGDPLLSITFSGNISQSTFRTARLYSMEGLWLNVSTSNGNASFTLEITSSYNYTGVLKASLSDPNIRSSMLSYFGIVTQHTTLTANDTVLTIEGTGLLAASYKEFSIHIANSTINGIMQQPFQTPVVNNTGYVDLSMLYPFGKNLTYDLKLILPSGSSDIQVFSSENYTIQNTTITWNQTIDNINVTFTPPTILALSFSKNIVGQGYETTINATVENQGTSTKTFNITIYADTTTLDQTEVTVTSENSTTVTITWNTASFDYGNYTISVYATPVSGEIDITDSTYTDGIILVTIPGDCNGDRTVDIFDIGTISSHWYPGPPVGPLDYNPNADINDDGAVGIFDIGITSSHWGESW